MPYGGLIMIIIINARFILEWELYDWNCKIVRNNYLIGVQIRDNNGILEHDLEKLEVFNFDVAHTPSIEGLLSSIFASTQDNNMML